MIISTTGKFLKDSKTIPFKDRIKIAEHIKKNSWYAIGSASVKEIDKYNIFNATLKAGTTSKEFIAIFEQKVLKEIDKFKPEVILISAGFDAHKRDPLANINLESEDFYQITIQIVDLSKIHSKGRIISFLEGGYDLLALSESIKQHLLALKN